VREPAVAVWRWILRRVEGRIHYHVIGRTGRQSRRRKRRRARANIEADGARAAGQVVAHRIVARQRDQCWIDLDQSDGQIADAAGDGEPRRTHPGSEIDQMLAGARRASCGQQNRIVAEAVALARLAQEKSAAKSGIFAGL
jgi:hypothetical protein